MTVAVPLSAAQAAGLVAVVVVAAVAGPWAGLFAAPGPVGQVVYTLSKAALLAVPLVWLIRREPGAIRFLDRPGREGWSVGAATGLAIGAALAGVYFTVGDRLLDRQRIQAMAQEAGFDDPFLFALLVAYWILVNPALEEFVWRWFVQTRLYRLMPPAAALPACALLFTAHHIVVLAAHFDVVSVIIGSAGVFAIGWLWSWLYWRYDSLWPGYVSHAVVDVALAVIVADLVFG